MSKYSIRLSKMNAEVLVSRINKKRNQFDDSPSFLGVVDSIDRDLKFGRMFTENELEWIYIATRSKGISTDINKDGNYVDLDLVRHKVREQIKKIRQSQTDKEWVGGQVLTKIEEKIKGKQNVNRKIS